MPRGLGSVQKKILILLLGGLSYSLAYTPRGRYRVLREMEKEWKKVDADALHKAIDSLYKSKLIDLKENNDGKIFMTISDNGRKKALEYKLDELEIKKPVSWDKQWRIVLFDIPKNLKKIREAFRGHLQRMGFYQYQKSVFIHPYSCTNELDFLIEFYNIRKYVRTIITDNIDNELHLRTIFSERGLIRK